MTDEPPGKQEGDRARRALLNDVHPQAWRNPTPNGPYNLVVIGAGPGGLAAAREAAALGARVALIERDRLGGRQLTDGSVQSKALIRTARLYADMRDAEDFGGRVPGLIDIGFPQVMDRMRRVQARLGRAASAQRVRAAGIDLYFGDARFTGADTVEVGGALLHFARALVATGTRPCAPPIPGLADAGYLTSENAFDLAICPPRLLIIGGGPIGCEMAQAFCRFGAHVIIAQNDPMFLPREERDAAQILAEAMARDGIEIHLNTEAVAVRREGLQKIVDLVCDDDRFSVTVDDIAAGVGRMPNVDGLDLDAAEVACDETLGIHVDDFLRTSNPRIFAAGDVCQITKFVHAAEASAHIAVVNALFLGRQRLSALTIPWCTYTDPEIAHVGLYIRDAWDLCIPVRTFTILMHDVDRAVTDGEDEGFVKIHVAEDSDRILGATVVARHAGEMINGLSLAIRSGIGLRALGQVIHTYPTQAGAIKMAADAYNRSCLTEERKRGSEGWLARSIDVGQPVTR